MKQVIVIMECSLETIKDKVKVKYLINLYNDCPKYSVNPVLLQNIIKTLEKETIEENILTVDANTETDVLSENTDYLYMKPWTRLNQIHKIIKIKEFINNLQILNKEKELLKNELIELIKLKSKKNKIIYDEEKGKIISISCLVYNNGKYILEAN